MTLTLSYLTNKFNEFNALYFNNSLPSIPLKIGNTKRRLGALHYQGSRPLKISISRYDNRRTEKCICTTLLHEMIHLAEHIQFGECHHRKFFKDYARKIKLQSNGEYNITRLSQVILEDGTAPKPSTRQLKTHTSVFIEFIDNRKCGLFVSKTDKANLDRILNYIQSKPHFEIHDVWSTTHRDAKKFLGCKTKFHRYDMENIHIRDVIHNMPATPIEILSVKY
jgi:hypothetical protein